MPGVMNDKNSLDIVCFSTNGNVRRVVGTSVDQNDDKKDSASEKLEGVHASQVWRQVPENQYERLENRQYFSIEPQYGWLSVRYY